MRQTKTLRTDRPTQPLHIVSSYYYMADDGRPFVWFRLYQIKCYGCHVSFVNSTKHIVCLNMLFLRYFKMIYKWDHINPHLTRRFWVTHTTREGGHPLDLFATAPKPLGTYWNAFGTCCRYGPSTKRSQIFFSYPDPGIQYGGWSPDSSPENIRILNAITWVRSDRSTKFRRLFRHFRGRSVQRCV